MRFIVYGAGAVGGVVGGRLVEHGHDVVLIARGAHGEAIRSGGLVVESPADRVTLDVGVVAHPGEIGLREGDVVMLAMKSQDTGPALDALRAVAPPDIPIFCVQNGVDNERRALRLFANVYAVCVMLPATHLEPGVVQAFSTPITGLLDLGRYPAGVDATAEAVAGALGGCRFESIVRPDIMRWKYTKLLMNLGNAVEALIGGGEAAGEVSALVRDEGIAVLRAAGIDFASREEDAERRGSRLQMHPIGGARRAGGSTWQSLQRGTGAVETDYLNGEIVLLGRQHGVRTPANALLQQLAAAAAARRSPPATMTAAEFLARAGNARQRVTG